MYLRKLALSGTSVHKNIKSVSNFQPVKSVPPTSASSVCLLPFNQSGSRNLHVGKRFSLTARCDRKPYASKLVHTRWVNDSEPFSVQISRALYPISYQKKAYSTQNSFRLSESLGSQLQPFLDIDNVMKNEALIQASIEKRKLSRSQVNEVKQLYQRAQDSKALKENVQQLRALNTERCQALMKEEGRSKSEKDKELAELKEKGRHLRDEIRVAENKFNEINDQLVDFILSLPNVLDEETPTEDPLLLKTVEPTKLPRWDSPEYTAIETNCGPGMLAEFPVGNTAWLDIDLRGRAQSHLLNAGFVETGNAEYVKRIILQGAGLDQSQFLRIREPNVKRGMEHATYLAGGASFPSFLPLFSQSVIEDASILPLRYFVIGRSYESQKNKPGYYQSHAVQVIVACRSEEEMQKEAVNLQNVMEAFYSEKVGFPFQTQIVPAPRLKMYEKKKLGFVMTETDKSPRKVIGTMSIVGDYVSKRLLCCYFNDKKRSQFLHLITARFFDITHFLRSPTPKLISHADLLAKALPPPEYLKINQESCVDSKDK